MRNKYLKIAQISAISQLVSWVDLLISSLFLVVILFVMKQLWVATTHATATQTSSGGLGGYTLQGLIWYMVGTELLILGLPKLEFTISDEVRSGDLAMRLKQPFHYLGYHLANAFGESTVKTWFNLLVAIPSAIFLVGAINPLNQLPALLIVFTLAYLLQLLMSSLIGLLSFWTEDITGIYFFLDRTKWLLGGMLLPLDLYPEVLKPWVDRLPFRYMLYEPAQLLVRFSYSGFLTTILFQGLWILLLGALTTLLYQAGVRRVNVQGG